MKANAQQTRKKMSFKLVMYFLQERNENRYIAGRRRRHRHF